MILIISFLIFAIPTYKRLNLGLYLVLFFLPTYLTRFKIGPIPFTFLEGMILILAVIWLVKKLQKKELIKSLQTICHKLQTTKWPIILLVVAATISVFVSPNRLSALGDWRAFFIEPLILFIIFLDLILTRTNSQLFSDRSKVENITNMDFGKIQNIFYVLGGSAIYISLFVIFQLFTGFMVPENYLRERRMTGFYGYPAAVGLYLAPIVAMFIGTIIEKLKAQSSKLKVTAQNSKLNAIPRGARNGIHLFFALTVVFLSIIAIAATKTEGAFLGIIGAVFIILLLMPWRKWVLIGSAIMLIIIMVIPLSRNYVIQKATFSDVSGDVRLVLWQGTFRALKANPIFGGGLSNFPTLYQKYKENRHVELLKYPHNIIFNFWSETGILGLFAFFWLIFEFFRKTFSGYNLKPKTYNLAIIAAMLSLLIYGLLDVPYFKNDLSVLFWVLVGLVII